MCHYCATLCSTVRHPVCHYCVPMCAICVPPCVPVCATNVPICATMFQPVSHCMSLCTTVPLSQCVPLLCQCVPLCQPVCRRGPLPLTGDYSKCMMEVIADMPWTRKKNVIMRSNQVGLKYADTHHSNSMVRVRRLH